jgi:hypothetical protein
MQSNKLYNSLKYILIYIFFIGCSNTENASGKAIKKYSEENSTLVTITSIGSSAINIGGSTSIFYSVANLKLDTNFSVESQKSHISLTAPSCSIYETDKTAICSTRLTGLSIGTDIIKIFTTGSYPNSQEINISVLDRNDSVTVSSLKSINLNVGTTSTVSFSINNAISSTTPNIKSTNNYISIGTPTCYGTTTKICSVVITGLAEGIDSLSIGVQDINTTADIVAFTVIKPIPVLTLSTSKNINLNVGATSTVTFSVSNSDSLTSVLSKIGVGTVASISTPICTLSGTAKNCTATITAKSAGSDVATIYVSGVSSATADINITVTELNTTLAVTSAKNINLNVGSTSSISFSVANFKTDTNISAISSNIKIVSVSNPSCISSGTTKSCSAIATAVAEGNSSISVFAISSKNSVNSNITFIIKKLVETNSSIGEINTTISDKNETNKTIETNSTRASQYLFGTGQLNNINTIENEILTVTTMLLYPYKNNKTIEVITQKDGFVSIGTTSKDISSDVNKTIFRTKLLALKSGTEKVIFKVKDSNLSTISMQFNISPYLCNQNTTDWNYLSAGEFNDEVIFRTKLNSKYNNVGLIYPQLSDYGDIKNQNFTYITIGENNKSVVSSSSEGFASFKIALELENEKYWIKYKTDQDNTFKCINGVFSIIQVIAIDEVLESSDVTSPPAIPPQ